MSKSVPRHLAWFGLDDGRWIGEWRGRVQAPVVPPGVFGDARLAILNAWIQETQRGITPWTSAYETTAQVWDLDAWDACPPSGAVCLDVTLYDWPVGDFQWAVFDGIDQLLDFREVRTYLELTPAAATLDASVHSARPVRSTPHKLVADVTGTPLAPWADHLHGRLVRRDGRIVFTPFRRGAIPEAVRLSITDRNADLAMLQELDCARLPQQETANE